MPDYPAIMQDGIRVRFEQIKDRYREEDEEKRRNFYKAAYIDMRGLQNSILRHAEVAKDRGMYALLASAFA